MEEETTNAIGLDTGSEEVYFENMEASKISTTSDYAQVIFSHIAKMYPIDAHIECKYTITSSLKPNKWDWIGLYKVGWMSPKDKVHYEWAIMPTKQEDGQETECSVLFHSYNLPEDDGEFYQFCYINSSGQVRGASTPFQFKRPGADDFVECEDEDLDMMVINTRSNMLQETIDKMEEEKVEFMKAQQAVAADRESILSKLVETSKQLEEERHTKEQLDTKLKDYETKIDQLHAEAKDMGDVHEMLQKSIESLTKDKEELEHVVSEKQAHITQLEGELRSMRNTVDQSTGRVQMLEEEKELFKNHFTTSEEKIVAFQTEIENLKKRLASEGKETTNIQEQLKNLEAELKKERKSRERMASLHSADKETIDSLAERYQNTKDKLTTMEGCKTMLNEQLKVEQEARDQMSSTMEKAKTEAHSLKIRLAKTEEKHKKETDKLTTENAQLQAKCDVVGKEKNELSAQLSEVKLSTVDSEKVQQGSLFAMREAYNSLKDQHAQLKKKYNVAKTEVKEVRKLAQRRQISHELKRENEDMRERLEMAKEEYINLYQKHRRTQILLEQSRRKSMDGERQRTTSETSDSASQYDIITKDASVSMESTIESLTNMELQSQLDELASELEERQAKKKKYKKQLIEEREKNQLLQSHYSQEYKKFQDELEKEREEKHLLQAKLDQASEGRGVDQVIVEQPRYTNPYINGKDTSALPPVVYPYEQAKNPPTENKYPNPYASSKETAATANPPSDGDQCFLEAGESAIILEEPLTPLPAPMQPQVLPSAKLAAVKHAVGLSSSSSESSLQDPDVLQMEEVLATDIQRSEVDPRGAASAPPMEETEEDRFHDAVGEPQRTCPVCSMGFNPETTEKQYNAHVNNHFVYCCPMCGKEFDKEQTSEEEFENHVQDHLKYT